MLNKHERALMYGMGATAVGGTLFAAGKNHGANAARLPTIAKLREQNAKENKEIARKYYNAGKLSKTAMAYSIFKA